MRAILTFHSIDSSGSVISFDASLFDELLAALAQKGIPVCDLDTLLSGGERKGVAITFDDGMKSVFLNALPVLQKYQARAHMFLSTGAIGEGKTWPQEDGGLPEFQMLNWQEVETLHSSGVYIESHTHTHPDMRQLDKDRIAEECDRADEIIYSKLGRRPKYFAYPFGYHNTAVREVVGPRYSGSVTTELRHLGNIEDSAALPRLDAYYLRNSASIRAIDTVVMRLYLAIRNSMRTLKGSQCVAGQT